MSDDAPAAPGALSRRQLWVILGSLMLGTALSALDTSIVNVALPTIAGRLGGFGRYAWVATSYVLTGTIATPLLGKLGDLYGRRRIVLLAIAVFLVGSLACAAARSMNELIAARALQGLGGGGIQALTFAVLGDLVSPRERGRYMGLYTGIFAGSAVLGPLLGGWMIDHFAWQWIFLVNLPLGAVTLAMIAATLKVPFARRDASLDLRGAALLSVCLGALVVALDLGRDGWTRPSVLGLLLLSIAAVGAFVAVERRVREPIIPLRLFRSRVFTVCSLMGFCVGSLSYGAQTFLPLYFQDATFATPTRAGLYLSPVMFGILFGSAGGGRVIVRTGRYKWLPISGLVCAVTGIGVIATRLRVTTPYALLVLPLVAIGLGAGATFTTTSIATQNAIDTADIGVGTATLISLRSLGGSLGLALYGTVFSATVSSALARRVPTGALPAGTKVGALLREPQRIRSLAAPVRDAIARSVTDGTTRVYVVALPIAVAALVLAVVHPERPLRTTAG